MLIQKMAEVLDWQVVGNRSEAMAACRALLALARKQVADEDGEGGEGPQ